MQHRLRRVSAAHVSVLETSIQKNVYDYRRGISVTVFGDRSGTCASRESTVKGSPGIRILKKLGKALQVDDRQISVALQELVAVHQ